MIAPPKAPSKNPELRPQEAKLLAHFIAMAPFVFQTTLCLRDFGVLRLLAESAEGLDFTSLQAQTSLSAYSLSVLLDAGESAGVVREEKDCEPRLWRLTETGWFLEKDPIAKVNMNFSQDVCYQGLFHLKEALAKNEPSGLKVFGQWPTIYEGLAQLPEKVQKSWFEFDHFYSDDCFPRALPLVFRGNPKTILDVGGNTGKFAIACTQADPEVHVTVADHPGQIAMARENAARHQVADRVHFHSTNLLHREVPFPEGHDVIWMSQLLSCFGETEVVMLLQKARRALVSGGFLFIMETFTDNQKFNTARFCLDMTSLYFTAMANGNSRMYRSEEFYKLLKRAELEVVEEHPHVRLNHTILKCRPMGRS